LVPQKGAGNFGAPFKRLRTEEKREKKSVEKSVKKRREGNQKKS
jgi:hypothetical protein